MKIESVHIQNLRSFGDETIPFNDYTCLVGPNGSGKSTVLCALNIFFRETDNASTDLCQLEKDDFHHQNTDEPVSITVTFCDLSKEAQEDFSDYFRLDRLVVSAVARFDKVTGKAEVRQYG
jgi:predicted ATP-dependent endonuclease of OLD family